MSELRLRKQLAGLLKEHNMTASELSRKTSIARQVISDWLGGVHPRNLIHVKRIADVFNITVDHLCFGTFPIPDEKSETYTALSHQLTHSLLHADSDIAGRYQVMVKKISEG
jgi:transcriptional regulator with XRE-family HTH domain